jgi:hypothetical protein
MVLFQLPFISAFMFLPLIPFAMVYDALIPGEFSATGTHVEIGFAWITLITWQAWVFYGSFFFLVGLTLGAAKEYVRQRYLNKN